MSYNLSLIVTGSVFVVFFIVAWMYIWPIGPLTAFTELLGIDNIKEAKVRIRVRRDRIAFICIFISMASLVIFFLIL